MIPNIADAAIFISMDSQLFRSFPQQRTGLPAKFAKFRKNIELTPVQCDRILKSHANLRKYRLKRLYYVDDSLLTGSYKKHTMIRPPNDVDIFVIINHAWNEITPNAVLKKLKRDLLGSYPNSVVRQDKPCIVLDFNHCKVELTPAIKVSQFSDLGYYIPSQGGNTWMQIESPRVSEERLSDANQRLNAMLTPLIKIMKAYKRHNNIKDKKSFELEDIAIRYLLGMTDYRDGVQQLLRAYNWTDQSRSHYEIEAMMDHEFASYCRTTLFGKDFPQ